MKRAKMDLKKQTIAMNKVQTQSKNVNVYGTIRSVLQRHFDYGKQLNKKAKRTKLSVDDKSIYPFAIQIQKMLDKLDVMQRARETAGVVGISENSSNKCVMPSIRVNG